MNVKLIQVDGKLPNLALMKLARHHRNLEDVIEFQNISSDHLKLLKKRGEVEVHMMKAPDLVYASVVFPMNEEKGKELAGDYPKAEFQIGGPGIETPTYLPHSVEHLMPDYTIYPELDYSMGFTTRGCFRKCKFCFVPRLEGMFRENAPIEEFHNPEFKKVMLMDNNLLASKNLDKTLGFIREHKLKTCISQGMDARIITPELAEKLTSIKSYDRRFTHKTYIFAWDNPNDEETVFRGLNSMLEAGAKPSHLMVYVLVGFDTNYKQDAHRLDTLKELGMVPYVMRYNHRRDDRVLNAMARWANGRFHRVCTLREYRQLAKLGKEAQIWGEA